jgi:hypothetical protein
MTFMSLFPLRSRLVVVIAEVKDICAFSVSSVESLAYLRGGIRESASFSIVFNLQDSSNGRLQLIDALDF